MSQHPEKSKRRRVRSLAKAVGLRVALAATLVVLAIVTVVDVGMLIPSWPSGPTAGDEFDGAADSGLGWPHLRGPNYDAISDETDLADSWPAEGPPVLWTLELGQGYSGFVAMGNRVFTQTQSLTRQAVVCLDADTGREIWRHRYDLPYDPAGMYPGPRATPTWHDGRIYFADPDGLLGCLQASDGQSIWKVNINEKFAGRGTEFGYSCSPLVEDGRVIMPVGGVKAGVVALNADNGSTAWTSGSKPASYCSALPITFRGRRLVVAFLENSLAIFDLATGKLLYEDRMSWGYNEHAAAPLYDEPYLVLACPFGSGAECFRIEPDETATDGDGPAMLDLKSVWYGELSNDTASSVLYDGHIYGFDLQDVQAKAHRPSKGKFKCLELTTGDVCWESEAPGHATVLVADGKLVLFNDRGEVLLVRASPVGYEELARAEVFSGEICWTAPTLHRGFLYLRSPTQAVCLYVGHAENLNQEQLARARPTSEIPKGGHFDLSWLAGGERQYMFDLPDMPELWRWYVFSVLGVLLPAGVLGSLTHLLTWLKWPAAASRSGRLVFWSSLFLFGAFGSAVYNRFHDEFVFTWIVCLVVAHQVVLNVVVRSGKPREGELGRPRLASALATIFFVGVCLSYYLLCRRFSMAVLWPFLLGFIPCWPLAVPAAYRLQRPGHPIRDFLWATATFSALYWSVGGFLLWKATVL